MDYNALKFWVDIVELIVILLIWIYMLFTNRHKANRSAITLIEKRTDERFQELGSRVLIAEQKISHQPGEEDIVRIYDKIDKVFETVNKLEGESRQVTHTLQLMQRHLLGSNR